MFKTSSRPRKYASAYHGKGTGRFRIPRPLLWGLVILAAAALLLWGAAIYLQQYMVYSAEGGHLVLPGQAAEQSEVDTSPLPDLAVVEETAPAGGSN